MTLTAVALIAVLAAVAIAALLAWQAGPAGRFLQALDEAKHPRRHRRAVIHAVRERRHPNPPPVAYSKDRVYALTGLGMPKKEAIARALVIEPGVPLADFIRQTVGKRSA